MPSPETLQQLRNITRKNLATKFWQRGDLRYCTKPHGQRSLYDAYHGFRKANPMHLGPFVANTHRGLGKSVFDVVVGLERALQHPGSLCFFGSHTEKDAIAIFEQTINDPIRGLKPPGIYWEIEKTKTRIRSKLWDDDQPWSTFFAVGLKEYAGTLRGKRCHFFSLDELREFEQAIDNVNAVVRPMFIGKTDVWPILITSTPPKTRAHPFTSYFVPRAEKDGAYFNISGWDNEDMTDEEIAMILADPEDRTSIEARREIGAELVEDLEAIMFPEFVKLKDEDAEGDPPYLVEARERPAFFFPFMSGDLGFVDYNAVLFSYVDFENQLLVIEDEYMNNGVSTGEFAQEVRHQEVELFFETAHFERTRRWCDNDPQDITNLQVDHGYTWEATDKHGKEMAIANLRMAFAQRRIRIHPRCKHLIFQLENAIRKEGETAKIERVDQVRENKDDPIIGHWDAIDALIYLHRMLKDQGAFMLNPFPYHVVAKDEFVTDDKGLPVPEGQEVKARPTDRITRNPLKVTRDSSLIHFGERARIR